MTDAFDLPGVFVQSQRGDADPLPRDGGRVPRITHDASQAARQQARASVRHHQHPSSSALFDARKHRPHSPESASRRTRRRSLCLPIDAENFHSFLSLFALPRTPMQMNQQTSRMSTCSFPAAAAQTSAKDGQIDDVGAPRCALFCVRDAPSAGDRAVTAALGRHG